MNGSENNWNWCNLDPNQGLQEPRLSQVPPKVGSIVNLTGRGRELALDMNLLCYWYTTAPCIGVGTDDAVALTQAIIGVHINKHTDVAQNSANVVLVRLSLIGIPTLIDLSKASTICIAFNFTLERRGAQTPTAPHPFGRESVEYLFRISNNGFPVTVKYLRSLALIDIF